MNGTPINGPIETKLQITSLSILPPDSQGVIPAGKQRFPFEFPIPTSLPTTTIIQDRLEIEYQLAATLHLSSHQPHDEKHRARWMDITRYTENKKKYVACTYMRVVKAMESDIPQEFLNTPQQIQAPPSPPMDQSTNNQSTTTGVPWNRRGLDNYESTYDQQHDLLARSLAGRSVGNITEPEGMDKTQGVRYKLGIDRTAVGLGTSINVEVMLEPTLKDAIVKSITLRILERRRYRMKVPGGYVWGRKEPETKSSAEKATMVLKWAESYSLDEQDGDQTKTHYIHTCQSDSRYLTYFEPPYPGYFKTKLSSVSEESCSDLLSDNETEYSDLSNKSRDLVNLKEMNEAVHLGEFFGGRFKMPVPDCFSLLHPSVTSESVKIDHWLKLVVKVECNGELFDLTLNTPGRILDCRLVNVDDKCQTLLPPPPSYRPNDEDFRWKNWTTCSFWQQREPITLKNEWGTCMPCPCEVKQFRNLNIKCSDEAHDGTERTCTAFCNWGPPPSYSEN